MTEQAIITAAWVGSLSPVSLASVLDQSVDCVKLVGLDGDVQYMNANGLCAMEIDDFRAIEGRQWADLWPEDTRRTILDSYTAAAAGRPVRFRAFCPTAKGAPRWWDVTVSSVTGADGAHSGYLSVSRDVTENEATREALEIAAAEMKHRLKNTYMMISSLLLGFARGDPVRETYAQEMADRLVALSTAQALFVSHEAPGDIRLLIPALLMPFDNPACPVVIECETAAQVDQGQADAIALVIGELSVNSAKHGALAHGGEVRVDSHSTHDRLTIHWTERSNIPPDPARGRSGQGLRLMERIMRTRRGTIDFAWKEDGLAVTLTFALG
jgi:PAS domain S-box-containing protein